MIKSIITYLIMLSLLIAFLYVVFKIDFTGTEVEINKERMMLLDDQSYSKKK